MRTYSSLNTAIYDLRKRGYRINFFHHQNDFLISLALGLKIPFKDIIIEETHSFPSLHQKGSISILYALTTKDGTKGILYDFKETTQGKDQPIPSFTVVQTHNLHLSI
jgi:hypothetical protein